MGLASTIIDDIERRLARILQLRVLALVFERHDFGSEPPLECWGYVECWRDLDRKRHHGSRTLGESVYVGL
jgi:hypothetical protein